MTFEELERDTIMLQRVLKVDGYYTAKVDGIRGPKTKAAHAAWLKDAKALWAARPIPDERTEGNLRTCTLTLQRMVRPWLLEKVLPWAKGRGLHAVRVIGGSRTDAQQNQISRACTNATGGNSYHNYGCAVDFGIFGTSDKDYKVTNGIYKDMNAACGTPAGLIWGGTWTSPVDVEHYQLGRWGSKIAGLRAFIAK